MLKCSDSHGAAVGLKEADGWNIHGVEVDERAGKVLLDEWELVDKDDSLLQAAAGADSGSCDKVVEEEED